MDTIPMTRGKGMSGYSQTKCEGLRQVTTGKTHYPKRIRSAHGHAIAGKANEYQPNRTANSATA
jgi:hypothetical protein